MLRAYFFFPFFPPSAADSVAVEDSAGAALDFLPFLSLTSTAGAAATAAACSVLNDLLVSTVPPGASQVSVGGTVCDTLAAAAAALLFFPFLGSGAAGGAGSGAGVLLFFFLGSIGGGGTSGTSVAVVSVVVLADVETPVVSVSDLLGF